MIKSALDPASFMLGTFLATAVWMFIYYPGRTSSRDKLMMSTKTLIDSQKGVVSVSDLAFTAGISPINASKFLKKLSKELEVEPEVDESGAIYYCFRTGKDISAQRQLTEKS